MLTERQARGRGAKLLARMDGTGWELRVFENAGWYYNVHRGTLAIYPDPAGADKTFFALLEDSPGPAEGGSMLWTEDVVFQDPNLAVADQIARARARVKRIVLAVDMASDAWWEPRPSRRTVKPKTVKRRRALHPGEAEKAAVEDPLLTQVARAFAKEPAAHGERLWGHTPPARAKKRG